MCVSGLGVFFLTILPLYHSQALVVAWPEHNELLIAHLKNGVYAVCRHLLAAPIVSFAAKGHHVALVSDFFFFF
jgi:hypothetical protein